MTAVLGTNHQSGWISEVTGSQGQVNEGMF